MKQSQTSNGKTQTENKDNLDSRHKEEETVKGDHITNNKKQTQSQGKKKG